MMIDDYEFNCYFRECSSIVCSFDMKIASSSDYNRVSFDDNREQLVEIR